jgi:error-prone DNA polymerase
LKSGKQMHEVAEEICRYAGLGDSERSATELLAGTRALADQCVLDPRTDLGLGEVHFPEFEVTGNGGARAIPGEAPADAELRKRCEDGIGRRYGSMPRQRIWKRLDDELEIIRTLGYASYFLTVGDVTQMVRELGIRSAARGSGAGSIVNYLLDISGIDPIRHGLLMERFLSPLRRSLPDIDIDVESARRLEVYDAILERYGPQRCATVSMMDTYKVRHAIRDVGAALGMPVGEIDAIAKAFPHIRARDARMALRDLPELRATGLAREAAAGEWGTFDLFFRLVESLDGLPRHIAMHPCGVLLSDTTLLDRTPVEQSNMCYPMSQFDKEDVEDLGLLKLDVLGIRMQSSMAHAVQEIERTEGVRIDLDDEVQVPFDDQRTYDMISAAKTLGVFQIESPGQRELVGKSGIETFEDIIADISLFRPGPVKSDMITPYLEVKQGWKEVSYLHEDLRPILERTRGVVVYHEQIIEMIAEFAGVSYAEGDEWRRALGDTDGMAETRSWFFPRALGRGYPLPVVEQIWRVIASFASFGFCKAHAAAFALPTYQSAWLKAHYPAHFLAGVLTHDPGMYPKRLILDDARQLGISVLGLDVNASEAEYAVEKLPDAVPLPTDPRLSATTDRIRPRGGIYRTLPTVDQPIPGDEGDGPAWLGRGWGIRIALGEVRGINDGEVHRIVTAREGAPYASLTDFWQRAQVSRPVVERLVQAGGFDRVYGIGATAGTGRRHRVTRRDLLLEIGDLDRLQRASSRVSKGRARGLPRSRPASAESGDSSVQLALELGEAGSDDLRQQVSGLPEMTDMDRVRAELDILGLDASRHVVDFHGPFLDRLGTTRSVELLSARSRSELLVAGVKVATQTPPIRSGRRVIFLTLDDATGPVDATFFEDVQGPYAATVFGSWLLVVRGELRRTGRRGVSLRATGAWDLGALHDLWQTEGMDAVQAELARTPEGFGVGPAQGTSRVMVHTSGFRMSPYADIKPQGDSTGTVTGQVARKLWHRSSGSAG